MDNEEVNMSSKQPKEKIKLNIEIDNLTHAQALAIEYLMKMWEVTGNVGASRSTNFFSDGDGNFHPEIKLNGRKPRWFTNPETDYGDKKYRFDKEEARGKYAWHIDPDTIGWLLREYKEEELMETL